MDVAEQELLEELQKADIENAVRQLYKRYYQGVVSQVRSNGGNTDDAADIFQEAVLVFIDKVKTRQFRGDSSAKTFLSAIAKNLWLSELRTRNRRNMRQMNYASESDKTEEPMQALFLDGNAGTLQRVMDELGDLCKKILTGFYYEDKSMKELLVSFNYENEQVLRNKKSKCMKKLKELLASNAILTENLKTLVPYEQ